MKCVADAAQASVAVDSGGASSNGDRAEPRWTHTPSGSPSGFAGLEAVPSADPIGRGDGAGVPKARRIRMLALVSGDLVALVLAGLSTFFAGSILRNALFAETGHFETGGAAQILTVFVPSLLVLLWRSWSDGHYTRYLPRLAELRGLLKTACVIGACVAFMLFALRSHFSRIWFGGFLVVLTLLVPALRATVKTLLMRRGVWFRPTWIIGAGPEASALARALESDPSLGHRVVGFVDEGAAEGVAPDGRTVSQRLPEIGYRLESPRPTGRRSHVEPAFVFAYGSLTEHERHRELLEAHAASDASISVVPPRYGLPLHDAEIVNVYRHETTLLRVRSGMANPRARFLKRVVDMTVSVAVLLLASPVLLCVGLLVRADGGPALFRHRRVGASGVSFDCLKFRSMRMDADRLLAEHLGAHPAAAYEWRRTRKLHHDPRVTRLGALLRRTSIDELPQLWNVLRGDMSLVGPRPIVEAERAYYAAYLPYYSRMTPGITGLWQVSGRSGTSYEERVELDVWYARHWSLWTDLVILFQTVPALFGRRGAY